MKKYILIAPITLLLCFYACTHKPQISVTPKTDSTPTTIPPVTTPTVVTTPTDTMHEVIDTSVCFQRDVLPIFVGSCAMSGCHSSASKKDGYDLTSYSTIIAKGVSAYHSSSSKVYTQCTKGKMPQSPIPKLDSTKLSYIRRWIDMGAHNDTNCAVNCDTTKFTYAAAIAPLLNTYCTSCHAASSAPASGGGIVLDNYNSVLVQAQNGKLLGDLQHLTGYNAMPQGGAMLSDCKITQFRKWIAAGAANN